VNSLSAVILASIATFTITNVDDILLLTLFFARRARTRDIVIGQYLGFGGIVALSLAVSWAAVSISSLLVRFLGLLPLAIGVKQLVQMHRIERKSGVRHADVLGIAAMTVANGADNIGIYVPFFAVHHTRVWIVLAIYAALLLLWCATGRWLGNHTLVLRAVDRYGHFIVPFVFISLGIYILSAGWVPKT
jgi:cadmium resistance protein CadD (predicted permease)